MSAKFKSFLNEYFTILVFPMLSVILATAIALDNPQVIKNRESVVFTYLENALKGHGGYTTSSDTGNQVSFAGLETGDIILGGYDYCAYGYFSHAGIYCGNNRVLEGYVDMGITEQSIDHYSNYSKICILRVEAPTEVKIKAVKYISEHKGNLFYPLSFKTGERYWNCTKIMWKAYADQGVKLGAPDEFWVSPDALYKSPKVKIIREEGR